MGAAAVAAVVLAVLLLYRMRRLFGAVVVSALGGFLALAAINLTGTVTGILLPVNLFSVGVSAVLGAPGVISLLLMQMFW